MRPPSHHHAASSARALSSPSSSSAAAAAAAIPPVLQRQLTPAGSQRPQQPGGRRLQQQQAGGGCGGGGGLVTLALGLHFLLANGTAGAFPSSSSPGGGRLRAALPPIRGGRALPPSAAGVGASGAAGAGAAGGIGGGRRGAPVVASVLFGRGGADSGSISGSSSMVVTRRGGSGGGGGARPRTAAAAAAAAGAADAGGSSGGGGPTFMETYDGVRRHRVAWDGAKRRFSVVQHRTPGDGLGERIQRYLRQSFLPEHVTPDYYHYTKWRVLQRLISATVSVFGTRALLLALGLKTERVGLTATFNWIQKDAFGKLGRIMWASKMGRRFDSDAKRWRFRSSLLFAAGTGLEVLTYIFPAAFLLLATVANILKQMSMLTSSATRNAMYKSFAGDSQNLGDITAKGEAQIAVVDLLGILLGISLSKAIGTAQGGMAVAYIALSMVDVFAIYNEIRSVVFTSLNLERGAMAARAFIQGGATGPEAVPTPHAVSRQERIFLNPAAIDPAIFRTVSQTGCSLDELHRLREKAFPDERFLVSWSPGKEGTSIVLHDKAGAHDILRALLTWAIFTEAWPGTAEAEEARRLWRRAGEAAGGEEGEKAMAAVRERVFGLLAEAHKRARALDKPFQEALQAKGWDLRHFVFGKIKKRTDW